ncbi:hypothetical protein, partial [Streptomyces sp. NPDC004728]|uniref:ATP-dependent DNA ligase n=1 Tax=Streptomyces sp. NPDC004728 TaxID=3154289 RepID=UPI0033AB1D7A
PGWWYEPKYDGHRTALRRTDETVVLYARSGRAVTQHWMDLAVAAMELRPGTVLDGETVIWRDTRLDFAAAQSRAASPTTRARALATRYPASYVCWDVLQQSDPQIGDCRHLPYTERRAFLLELLTDVGPPVQVTPATDDRDVAVLWCDALREQGIEGIVCKRGGAGYLSGRRRWLKVRHADTVDALVLGFTGSRLRPHHLVLAVGDEGGPARVSARREPVLAARVGEALSGMAVVGEWRAEGEPYTRTETDMVVEVLAGSGRHGTLTVTHAVRVPVPDCWSGGEPPRQPLSEDAGPVGEWRRRGRIFGVRMVSEQSTSSHCWLRVSSMSSSRSLKLPLRACPFSHGDSTDPR